MTPEAPVSPTEPLPEREQPRPSLPAAPEAMVVGMIGTGRCRVWHEGAERNVTLRDAIRRTGLLVGDRVRVRDRQVVEVAKRQTLLVSRDADTLAESLVAVNMNQLLILVSARKPDFHASVLARHLFYAECHGVALLICLTKGDLVGEEVAADWLEPFRTVDYPALVVGAAKSRGFDELKASLDQQVTALIGHPGAGKSTLLTALAGEDLPNARDENLQVRPIMLSPNTWLFDMPELRELGVWKPDLSAGFKEFRPHSAHCSPGGCLHREESGCAVRMAVEKGHIARTRYLQYRLLLDRLGLA